VAHADGTVTLFSVHRNIVMSDLLSAACAVDWYADHREAVVGCGGAQN